MNHDSPERRLVLASSSLRRRGLIKALDIPVEFVSPGAAEGTPVAGEGPAEYVLRLSREKAEQAACQAHGAAVLGADTVVVEDGRVLGKPSSPVQAARMLRRLRGRRHTVVTGITLLNSKTGRWSSSTKITEVTMRNYSDEEIAAYVASGEPLDKAGGYAVQDERFRPAVKVQGCYLNVVGLPLCEVLRLLNGLIGGVALKKGWQLPAQCQDCPLERRSEALEVRT